MSLSNFKVGDEVWATERIVRVDNVCKLEIGEKAKICTVNEVQGTQIVSVELPNGHRMISIVCSKKGPLKLVK